MAAISSNRHIFWISFNRACMLLTSYCKMSRSFQMWISLRLKLDYCIIVLHHCSPVPLSYTDQISLTYRAVSTLSKNISALPLNGLDVVAVRLRYNAASSTVSAASSKLTCHQLQLICQQLFNIINSLINVTNNTKISSILRKLKWHEIVIKLV